MPRHISPTVISLSLVSLFTDLASEMLYPVMPLYLQQVGFSFLLIGVLEGCAEAIAGLSKGYFGKWSDMTGRRLPFVQVGYAFSAISKPMIALFTNVWWIFICRSIDRVGKGVRTGARDALLSDEATPATKATVFGFHRSMDTVGAMLGPSLALVILYYYPFNYILLFYLAFIPGLLAVFTTWFVKEKKKTATSAKRNGITKDLLQFWTNSNVVYRRLCIVLLAFSLVNSSTVFLLLKMKESGVSDTMVIGPYIFYNAVYALLAYPFGILADKIGLRKIMIAGLLLFATCYAGFSVASHFYQFILLFVLYGAFAAATEGVAKAWISNVVATNETATAIGVYSGLQSVMALFASSLAGFVWMQWGSEILFASAACLTIVICSFLYSVPQQASLVKAKPDAD